MRANEVDFTTPVFGDHPIGWQSPSDLVEGFTLAWALELTERQRISPYAPFGDGVRERLSPMYRFDTLGRLITLRVNASGASFRAHPIVRLTTLCGAWQLFDLLNAKWQMQPYDVAQFADVLSYVTGGQDRPSLFEDLSANPSKCLLAIRARRTFGSTDELDLSEEWFITGDEDLTFRDARGNDALLFHFTGMNQIPLALFSPEFVETVWATARVTVDQLGPDRVIRMFEGRIASLTDLLARGGAKAAEAQRDMSPLQFQAFNYWPGWASSV
ncbi:hypothetical protein LG315_11920 [Microbacterium marinum]|uniref:hypothetical protein n=1 Tax=Microbacterium marinum TaxID=421115 RepID=UPI00385069C1